MSHKPILVWVVTLAFIAGCAGDSTLDPLAQSAVTGSALFADHQNLAVSGAGLLVQPTRIRISVPVADPADILEAGFYWMGHGPTEAGDDTILIDGVPRAGTLVSSRNVGGTDPWVLIYKLDGAGIVVPGSHDYVVQDFDPGSLRRGGIALAVVYRDPLSQYARIRTIEPYEFVRWDMPGHEQGAVWSFPIEPIASDRLASLTVVTSDCESQLPDRVWWEAGPGSAPAGDIAGSGNLISDQLRSAYGPWLDVLRRPVLVVPAGSEHFAYQLESPTNGDAIVHLFGAVGVVGDEPASCSGTIGDVVWDDLDGDGVQDAGEPGMPGVDVTLYDAGGDAIGSAVTDALGRYEFAGLCSGDYSVEVATPSGFVPSPCDQGSDDNLDSDCSPAAVTLSRDSEPLPSVDFGFTEPPPPLAPGCFFGVGFWKHEIDVLTGENPGRPHFTPEEVGSLLEAVDDLTALGFAGSDGVLTAQEAAAYLDGGNTTVCGRANRHVLAALLNFAANGSDPTVAVDTDGDGVPDDSFGNVIDSLRALLATGSPADCRAAGDLAASVNGTQGGNCPY